MKHHYFHNYSGVEKETFDIIYDNADMGKIKILETEMEIKICGGYCTELHHYKYLIDEYFVPIKSCIIKKQN